MKMFHHAVRLAALLAMAGLMSYACADEPKPLPLNEAFYKQAPAILSYLKKHDVKNVGVIKFLVKVGDGKTTDSAGPLNMAVASQLEIALMVNRANDAKGPIGVIGRASAVAATIPGASHLTKEGRQKLFTKNYPLAWGQQEVTPDAFLTGVVEVAPDLKTMNVQVQAFGKDGAQLDKVVEFPALCKSNTLAESGQSFLVRGFADEGKVIVHSHAVKSGKADHPWKEKETPLALEVRYNGKLQPVAIKDGHAWVPEPQQGDKVVLVLKRNDNTKDRYAAVLKVNGENTLYKQRFSPELCSKWVLDPGAAPIYVEGYKIGPEEKELFRVLSRQESKESEVYYGADIGTISLTVFREKRKKVDAPLLNNDEMDMSIVHRGVIPEKDKPKTLAALRSQFSADIQRGAIGAGEVVGTKTYKVEFDTDPTPVMALTLTYYKP